jgi:periplasmic protein TonB
VNSRAPLLALGDRAGLRLASAIVLAALLWLAFLVRIGWLFGSAPQPVMQRREMIEMRLVEAAPQSAAVPATPDSTRQRAVERPLVHVPPHSTHSMQAAPRTASPTGPARATVAAPARDTVPREAAVPQQPERTTDESAESNGTSTSPRADSPVVHASPSGSTPARLLSQPLPVLPDDLRDQGYQAVAVARFQVHADGSFDVELVKPTQNPRLNQILLETLRKWRFFPAMESGRPVESRQDVRVHFNVS